MKKIVLIINIIKTIINKQKMQEISDIFNKSTKKTNSYEELDKNTTNSEYHGEYSNYNVKRMITEYYQRIRNLKYIEEHLEVEEILKIEKLRKQILTKLNCIQAKNFDIKENQINYNIANQIFLNYIE